MIKILVNNITLDNYFAKSDTIRLKSDSCQFELLIKKTEGKFELELLKDNWRFDATDDGKRVGIIENN